MESNDTATVKQTNKQHRPIGWQSWAEYVCEMLNTYERILTKNIAEHWLRNTELRHLTMFLRPFNPDAVPVISSKVHIRFQVRVTSAVSTVPNTARNFQKMEAPRSSETVGILPQHFTASQTGRPRLESSRKSRNRVIRFSWARAYALLSGMNLLWAWCWSCNQFLYSGTRKSCVVTMSCVM
jgi:hypothetical protein